MRVSWRRWPPWAKRGGRPAGTIRASAAAHADRAVSVHGSGERCESTETAEPSAGRHSAAGARDAPGSGRGRRAHRGRPRLRRGARRLECHDRPPSRGHRPLHERGRRQQRPSRFARELRLPVSIRGGAHNVAGHAVCDGGLMIDLSRAARRAGRPGAAARWVEGGAIWRDVDRATQAFGLAVPGGLISDTGVAGPHAQRGHRVAAQPLRPHDRQSRRGRCRHGRRPARPRERRGACRSAVGAQGRGRQFRRRHRVRVRPARGGAEADVLRSALSAHAPAAGRSASGGTSSRTRATTSARSSSSRRSRTTPTIPSSSGANGSTPSLRSTPATPTTASSCSQPLREPRRAGRRLLRPDGLLRHPAVVRHADAVRPATGATGRATISAASAMPSSIRSVEGNAAPAVAQHALVDLELRRRHGACRRCRFGLRRPLDAVHVLDRLDLGVARRRRRQHRLDARRSGSA